MQSSQAITDYRMLPRPCLCSKPTGLPYSQRLRIDRSCMSNVITYDVSSCTVVVSGSGYVVDDILQIVGGFPEKQTGSIKVISLVSSVEIHGVDKIQPGKKGADKGRNQIENGGNIRHSDQWKSVCGHSIVQR